MVVKFKFKNYQGEKGIPAPVINSSGISFMRMSILVFE